MKFLSTLFFAGAALAAPAITKVSSWTSATTLTSHLPTQTISQIASHELATPIPTVVPTKPQEVVEVILALEVDVVAKLELLNSTILDLDVDVDVDVVVNLVETVLKEVIVLVQEVVTLLGKVVGNIGGFLDIEIQTIAKALVHIIVAIVTTVQAIIVKFHLGSLLAVILKEVTTILVSLLTVVLKLVSGLLVVVVQLLKDTGLLELVGSLLGAVLSLLGVVVGGIL